MKIHLIAAGRRPPRWIDAGFREYARRLRGAVSLELTEIAPKNARELARPMLRAVPGNARVVALDIDGWAWSTRDLAEQARGWLHGGRPVALLVGGADGLPAPCLERADERWSLGPLTLPHMLVRVVVAEQLYRAVSLLENHPYHRA